MSEMAGMANGKVRAVVRRWVAAHPAAAAAALMSVVVLAAGGAGLAAGARTASSPDLSSTVVPATAGQPASAPVAAAAGGAGSTADAGRSAAVGAASTPAGAASSGPVGGSCASAPTVQLQGRGLAATGVATVTPSASPATALVVSLQQHGGDASAVIASVQAKVQAVIAALQQAGVPASGIQQVSFNSYGDTQGPSFTAYATIQAQLASGDQLAQASKAVFQVGGVTGYSTSSTLAAQPTSQEVQQAVQAAASQARDMAAVTARAAGVALGSVQGVATQPPSVCYGPGGAAREVQVTVTYAIK